MAALTTDSNILALACSGSSVAYRFESGAVSCLREPMPETSLKNNSSENDSSIAVCSAVSSCGRYYVLCHGKSMCLIDTSDWTVSTRWSLNKSVSRVRFVPNSDSLVVADKSGDVYVYSASKSDKSGDLLLGHLSVLLDVLVTPDLKYIITCDRDEKIRVSHYPNSYNIHGYCLGHEEFVTSIDLLPHNEKVLVSCSGDCTIRFWNYIECVELLKYNSSPDINEMISSDSSLLPAITKCCLLMLGSNTSQIVTSFSNVPGVAIYLVNSVESALKCSLQQIIKTSVTPWHLAGYNNRFWLLLKDKCKYLTCYDRIDCIFEESTVAEDVISKWASHKIHENLQNIFSFEQVSILYKRKFDNVQEYLEKKKSRLEAASEERQEK